MPHAGAARTGHDTHVLDQSDSASSADSGAKVRFSAFTGFDGDRPKRRVHGVWRSRITVSGLRGSTEPICRPYCPINLANLHKEQYVYGFRHFPLHDDD